MVAKYLGWVLSRLLIHNVLVIAVSAPGPTCVLCVYAIGDSMK